MALVLLHARYARTCTICGETWVVTRRQARRSPGRAQRPRAIRGGRAAATGGSGRSYDVAASRAVFTAAVEQWQAWRRCPRCGIDDFTQVPVGRDGRS